MKRVLLVWGLSGALACAPQPTRPNVPGPTTAEGTSGRVVRKIDVAAEAARLVVLRRDDAPVVAFRVAFAAGSADDPPGKEGLTRLVAETMTDGGTAELSYAELLSHLFPMAAHIRAHVDRDEVVFEGEVAKEDAATFFSLFRDVLFAPRMDAESIGRLRAKALSTLVDEVKGGDDETLGKEALQAVLYEGQPYGHPPIGTERGLLAITEGDVRVHRPRVFCKERMAIGLAGGLPSGFERWVLRELLARAPACAAPRATLPTPSTRDRPRALIVDKRTADAAAISYGYPVTLTRADNDYPAVRLLTDALGLHRQSSGVLFRELRERRGLNYGDYAYIEAFSEEGGSRYARPNLVRRQQYFSVWIRPTKRENALFALQAALHFQRLLAREGLHEDTLERSRGFLSRYIGLEAETDSRRLGYAMDGYAYGLQEGYTSWLRHGWESAGLTGLRTLAATHLGRSDVTIVVVTKDGADMARALVQGRVSAPSYDAPKDKALAAEDELIRANALKVALEDVRVIPVSEMFR